MPATMQGTRNSKVNKPLFLKRFTIKVGLLGNKEPLDLDLKDKLDCRMREVFHAEEIEVTMV